MILLEYTILVEYGPVVGLLDQEALTIMDEKTVTVDENTVAVEEEAVTTVEEEALALEEEAVTTVEVVATVEGVVVNTKP